MQKWVEIKIGDSTLEVGGVYQPKEPQEDLHPGCDESFEIEELYFNGEDVFDLIEFINQIGYLENIALEQYKKDIEPGFD